MKFFLMLMLTMTPIMAEDWTVAGKTYHDILVTQVEADKVHVTYEGGIGTIPLVSLPPDLRKKFSYDPEKAKQATDAEAARLVVIDQAHAQFAMEQKKRTIVSPIVSAQAPTISHANNSPIESQNQARIQFLIEDLAEKQQIQNKHGRSNMGNYSTGAYDQIIAQEKVELESLQRN